MELIGRHRARRLVEDEGAQLVEVLPAPQYERAHLPGAISIPLKEFSEETLAQLDATRPVVVYCSSFL